MLLSDEYKALNIITTANWVFVSYSEPKGNSSYYPFVLVRFSRDYIFFVMHKKMCASSNVVGNALIVTAV